MRQGASVVWHLSLPLMNTFNKTEAAVFSFRPCFLRAFLFFSFLISNNYYIYLERYFENIVTNDFQYILEDSCFKASYRSLQLIYILLKVENGYIGHVQITIHILINRLTIQRWCLYCTNCYILFDVNLPSFFLDRYNAFDKNKSDITCL